MKSATPQKPTASTAFEKAAKAAALPVQPGKTAVQGRYRDAIEGKTAKTRFTGSVDMDAAFKKAEPTTARWDFGMGVALPGQPELALWVEPHSAASTGEVKKILAKLDWLQAKLQQPSFRELKALTDTGAQQGLRPYHWLASANVAIKPVAERRACWLCAAWGYLRAGWSFECRHHGPAAPGCAAAGYRFTAAVADAHLPARAVVHGS